MSAEPRPTLRRVVALSLLWASASAAALLSPGCYGRNCEGSFEVFGNEPGQGTMIDENTWQSNAADEAWLPFPRQRYYVFDLHALGGRTPDPIPYISPSPNPTKDGMDFVVGSGNVAKLLNQSPNRIDVLNDTCSDFYLRLKVEAPPFPPAASADGGADDAPDAADPTDDDGGGGDDLNP